MIVITGANGQLGRLVVKALVKQGITDNVILTGRDPSQLEDLAALGFTIKQADFAEHDSLVNAFAGADTLLMISATGPVEARKPLHKNCIDATKAAGVKRLVYTSRVNPSVASLYPFAAIHVFTEQYLRDSGLTTTIVRNNEYLENIIPAIKKAKETGELLLPGASGRLAHIGVVDIAEILAKLLTEDGHENKVYELNGPEAFSRDEIAALIEEKTGKALTTGPVDGVAFGQLRKSQGRPQFMVEMVEGLFNAIDAGEFAKVWSDAQQLLNRPQQSVRKFIETQL